MRCFEYVSDTPNVPPCHNMRENETYNFNYLI